jgi:hypothetical protein
LVDALLDDKARLADIQWNGVGAVNLTRIEWERVRAQPLPDLHWPASLPSPRMLYRNGAYRALGMYACVWMPGYEFSTASFASLFHCWMVGDGRGW